MFYMPIWRMAHTPQKKVPSLKLTASWPLKMDGWKMTLLLGKPYFQVRTVGFREGTSNGALVFSGLCLTLCSFVKDAAANPSPGWSPLKGDMGPNKYPLYQVYMWLIIQGPLTCRYMCFTAICFRLKKNGRSNC